MDGWLKATRDRQIEQERCQTDNGKETSRTDGKKKIYYLLKTVFGGVKKGECDIWGKVTQMQLPARTPVAV
ncbi:hypothetical protein E2C01_028941 [Portunus trituberculatus]|uniref:Uncharacterized protein n=1 Tax=Portunus trituberculatus TaxID=210409 RepID=A0A5B7EQL6_PORTR|nr:hypothetical protein [Portunus trituberculatus]